MKLAVYDTSWLRNVQYDLDCAVKVVESGHAMDELQEFIRKHRSEATVGPVSGAAATAESGEEALRSSLLASHAEAMRPLLRALLVRCSAPSDLVPVVSEGSVADLCRCLRGDAGEGTVEAVGA